MKRKIALLVAAIMTMSMAVPVFAHDVVIKGPTEKTEETTKEEAAAQETTVEEKTKVEPVVTRPTNTRTGAGEESNSQTFKEPREPKTIFNTAPSAEHPFSDVTGANDKYIKAAYALGMTWGVSRGTMFDPEGTLSLEDAVTFLYRLEGAEGKNGIILAKISEANGYAQKPLTWAAGLGLIDRAAEPKSAVTVSQLKDMIEKLGYETNIVGTDNTMTRMSGLITILDSIIGGLDEINFGRYSAGESNRIELINNNVLPYN